MDTRNTSIFPTTLFKHVITSSYMFFKVFILLYILFFIKHAPKNFSYSIICLLYVNEYHVKVTLSLHINSHQSISKLESLST